MSSNLNIFEQLNQDSEGQDFLEVINRPAEPTKFSGLSSDSSRDNRNIFESLNEEQKEETGFGFLQTARDIGEQVAKKGISGLGGAYGNILETFGLQLKPGETLPGEQARNAQQFQILEKIQRGETPSAAELMLLSEDSELPSSIRLPTSKEIQQGLESVTGIGGGKTTAGRIAGRGAEFLGEGLAIPVGGAKALSGLAASGLAGQTLRESGAPELAASATEIAGSIAPSAISRKLAPVGKKTKEIVKAGRKLGLSEAQITPLIQGESKTALLSKVARKGTKTREQFASIKESLGDSYQNIKNSVADIGNVDVANQRNLIGKFSDIRDDLSKTLKASPDKEAAIKFIDEAVNRLASSGTTPEELINFWQDINKSVKWNSIQGGKKSLTRLKEPILEVLNNVAPEAAKDFEMTNQLYTKYSQISKKLKPDLVDSFVNKAEVLAFPATGLALIQGNPWPLAALGGESAIRSLSREMLTNPYFQNIASKLVTNFNSGSVKGVSELVKQVQQYMERKHPNENWDFLVED